MKPMFVGLAFSLLSAATLANGDFATGSTNAVRFAANGAEISVCSYWPIYPAEPGALKTEWKCYLHPTAGARNWTLVDDLPLTGETRVIGARWAEALGSDGIWRAMSKD